MPMVLNCKQVFTTLCTNVNNMANQKHYWHKKSKIYTKQTMDLKVKAILLEKEDMKRAITRMAHEIIENNHGIKDLALVGIHRRGCLLYTSPSPRDSWASRMPSSAWKKKKNTTQHNIQHKSYNNNRQSSNQHTTVQSTTIYNYRSYTKVQHYYN